MKRLLITLLCVGGSLSGCSEKAGEPVSANVDPDVATVRIGAINMPLAYFAERLGGESVLVTQLAPAGVDPADWTPGAEDVLEMQSMDLILLNGAGYEPWLDRVSLPYDKLVDTSAGMRDALIAAKNIVHQHGPQGTHSHGASAYTIWLDPLLAIEQARTIGAAIRAAIGAVGGEPAEMYALRLAALEADLRQLHSDWQLALQPLQGERVLFSHPVYQYFERRYALDGASVHWEADAAPDESQWSDFREMLDEHPARVMIWERKPLETSAAKLAALGIRVIVIDPGAEAGGQANYLNIQQANVTALRAAGN
jgi:zinc transport system substrate-binding protein